MQWRRYRTLPRRLWVPQKATKDKPSILFSARTSRTWFSFTAVPLVHCWCHWCTCGGSREEGGR